MDIRLGFAGLGAASRQILPSIDKIPGVKLVAVADVRSEALDAARESFPGVSTYDEVADLANDPGVDAVWIATPNNLHAEHVIQCASGGKHVIAEKPMAITLDECDAMVAAVTSNNVKYVQGHSKLHGAAVRKIGTLIADGEIGRVVQISSVNSNDWLRRPRLESELDTSKGGGIAYRQGPHQIDIVRYFGGGLVDSVYAKVGRNADWRDADGDYSAFLHFENGASGIASINGYGHFDASELTWDIGESGAQKLSADRRDPAPVPEGATDPLAKYKWVEESKKEERVDRFHPFFGLTVVSGTNGTIRQSPDGIFIYKDGTRTEIKLDHSSTKAAELLELQRSLETGDDPFPGALWGRATLAVCLSIMESSQADRVMTPASQVGIPTRVAIHS